MRLQDELMLITDLDRRPLIERTTRIAAVDASQFDGPVPRTLVEPSYTLGDQLFVDPHPLALPDRINLDETILMSPQEVAVAASHVSAWQTIAAGRLHYALVLEDDVWFHPRFGRVLDSAWSELQTIPAPLNDFDVLYLSYREVDHGADKVPVSPSLFSPFRGLWHLSGYVLSRGGARQLLGALPVRGPVDLWINHQFARLKVVATTTSIINQRIDGTSSNSYSVLPALSRAGLLNSETPGQFLGRPSIRPVFVSGPPGSGLSSMAMALSMLGYTCCSDVSRLPPRELAQLLSGRHDRVFDAYVNVGDVDDHLDKLAGVFPDGRLILTGHPSGDSTSIPASAGRAGSAVDRVVGLPPDDPCAPSSPALLSMTRWTGRSTVIVTAEPKPWNSLCGFLRCVPPPATFPRLTDLGMRSVIEAPHTLGKNTTARTHRLRFDHSPWIAQGYGWSGVRTAPIPEADLLVASTVIDDLRVVDPARWTLRSDTFSGNLSLFRPGNFEPASDQPARLVLRREDVGVRRFTSAAITTRDEFLYGRFEATLRPAKTSGTVTGVFLHRDSPRQEIDIEFLATHPGHMLTNVYFNPGTGGARFDYGYRGTPILVELGFDPTTDLHSYAIEWTPDYIAWHVDGRLLHVRTMWEPTPIPHLPMTFHVNLWPSQSRALAGKLSARRLPAVTELCSIRLPLSVDPKCQHDTPRQVRG